MRLKKDKGTETAAGKIKFSLYQVVAEGKKLKGVEGDVSYVLLGQKHQRPDEGADQSEKYP